MNRHEIAAKMQELFAKCGIKTTAVTVLGKFVHVDSFLKHSTQLQHVLTSAGFTILRASDCTHLDGFSGFRVSAKLAK